MHTQRFWSSIAAIALIVAALTPAAPARAQDPADIAEGARIFANKGGCTTCHGWAGDGEKLDNQAPDGANLRESPLSREDVTTTVKCGRPGRDMPAFDRLAYSDGRCFGLKLSDLQARGLSLYDPPATLQPGEIASVVEFLFAKIVGKGPMDHAKCVDLLGPDAEPCSELK